MRIVILGNAGSGKSTLGKALARRMRSPLLDLDTLVWAPDRVGVQRPDEVVRLELAQFCRESADWVIEGCYADLVAATLSHQPLLVFLDPGGAACLANCRARPWEPHKYRSKQAQDALLEPLLAWVRGYYERDGAISLAGHRAVFDAYRGPRRHVTRLDELDATILGLDADPTAPPPARSLVR